MSSGGKGSATTGYKYFLGLHMILCQKMDYIRSIRVEDRIAWRGLANNGQLHINKPALFGDPDTEGGFVSLVDVLGGDDTQGVNDYLQTHLGGDDIPAFRDVVSLVYRHAYIGNAPFLRKIWHHVTSIYQTYNNWLPQYAPVASRGLSVSDREGGWIYFAIDVSFSMFDPTYQRWEYAETLLLSALESLKGKSPNLFFATFDEDTTARETKQYLNASDADIDEAKAWVSAITYAGTAGVDVASDYRGGAADAADFFAIDDPASAASGSLFDNVFTGTIPNVTPEGTTNASSDGSRQLFFVSDGRPVPTSSAIEARATLDEISNLQIHGLAINNDDPTYADILTNYPSNISGSIGSSEDNLAPTWDSLASTDVLNVTGRPTPVLDRWQVSAGDWPSTNRLNFASDGFDVFADPIWGDAWSTQNTGTAIANLWIEKADLRDGSTYEFSYDYEVYRNYVLTGTINIVAEARVYGLTAAEYAANGVGTFLGLGEGNVPSTTGTSPIRVSGRTAVSFEADLSAYDYFRILVTFDPPLAPGGGAGFIVQALRNVALLETEGAPLDLGSGLLQDALIDQYDINPIHILRDMVVNPVFGGTSDESEIGASFATAAKTCFDEGMGVTFFFESPRDKASIKETVEEHMDGHMFFDRGTGKWEVKLIRSDYDVADLFTFDTSEITDWVNLERPLQEDLPNQVTVNYTKRENGEPASITMHNVAAIQQVGKIIPVKKEYPGLTVESLAASVTLRDLRGLTVPLWRGQFRCRYVPTNLNIGSAFILTDARVGLDAVVCRITEIDDGDGRSNEAMVSFVEDKFSLDDNALVVGDVVAQPDRDTALPPTDRLVVEMPYFVAAVTVGDTQTDDELADDADLGYLMATCDRPNQYHSNALIAKYNGSDWYRAGSADFSPYCTLAASMDADADTTTFTCAMNDALYLIESNELIYIDDEIMTVSGISVTDDVATVTVGRGALDTVPRRHEIGAGAFFWFNAFGTEFTPYTAGQSEDIKLLPRTRSEALAPADAETDTVTFASRMIRPYPPGNFQIEGAYSLSGVQIGDLDGTWNHRDRLVQTVIPPEDYTDADVGPEAGVSYTPMRRMANLRGDLFDLGDIFGALDLFTLDARDGPWSYTPTSGKTHTFSADDADLFDAADLFDLSDLFEDAFGSNMAFLELGVKSVRDGYDNFQTKWVRVDPILPPVNLTATEV